MLDLLLIDFLECEDGDVSPVLSLALSHDGFPAASRPGAKMLSEDMSDPSLSSCSGLNCCGLY